MTVSQSDAQSLVARTYLGLADLMTSEPQSWNDSSLCADWQICHVIAHVTMPARFSPEQFGAEMAAAGGDFTKLANTVATRDAALPRDELLAALRSEQLHAWEPPGGGADGALSHAVIHSLDVTVALGRPSVAPQRAVATVLDRLVAAEGATFGIDLTGVRLEADGTDWSWGSGRTIRADRGELVALLAGRSLPDGRHVARR